MRYSSQSQKQILISMFRELKKAFWILFFLCLPQSVALGSPSALCPADLKNNIESVIERPEFASSRWGILVKTLQGDQTLYALDENKYFVVASNVKLLTSAAALRELGPEYRIRTSLYGEGSLPSLSALRVVGRGDPTLSVEQLKNLAQQLKQAGVRHISELVIEDGYFRDLPLNPAWEWSDLVFYYATSVNSAILNENAVLLRLVPQQEGKPLQLVWSDPQITRQWRVNNQSLTSGPKTGNTINFHGDLTQPTLNITGQLASDLPGDIVALSIPDPGNYFLNTFRNLLLSEGITVTRGRVSQEPYQAEIAQELAFIESPPVADLLKKINQDSNNLVAEVMMRTLGAESLEGNGLAVIRENLTQLGINPEGYVIFDGSGLSRQNIVTPQTLVAVLQKMAESPEAEIYINSLAVAGQSGTLKRRFVNTPVVGQLRGKTSTLAATSALTGYLNIPNYQPVVFSIVINHSDQPVVQLRQAIDEIVKTMARLKRC